MEFANNEEYCIGIWVKPSFTASNAFVESMENQQKNMTADDEKSDHNQSCSHSLKGGLRKSSVTDSVVSDLSDCSVDDLNDIDDGDYFEVKKNPGVYVFPYIAEDRGNSFSRSVDSFEVLREDHEDINDYTGVDDERSYRSNYVKCLLNPAHLIGDFKANSMENIEVISVFPEQSVDSSSIASDSKAKVKKDKGKKSAVYNFIYKDTNDVKELDNGENEIEDKEKENKEKAKKGKVHNFLYKLSKRVSKIKLVDKLNSVEESSNEEVLEEKNEDTQTRSEDIKINLEESDGYSDYIVNVMKDIAGQNKETTSSKEENNKSCSPRRGCVEKVFKYNRANSNGVIDVESKDAKVIEAIVEKHEKVFRFNYRETVECDDDVDINTINSDDEVLRNDKASSDVDDAMDEEEENDIDENVRIALEEYNAQFDSDKISEIYFDKVEREQDDQSSLEDKPIMLEEIYSNPSDNERNDEDDNVQSSPVDEAYSEFIVKVMKDISDKTGIKMNSDNVTDEINTIEDKVDVKLTALPSGPPESISDNEENLNASNTEIMEVTSSEMQRENNSLAEIPMAENDNVNSVDEAIKTEIENNSGELKDRHDNDQSETMESSFICSNEGIENINLQNETVNSDVKDSDEERGKVVLKKDDLDMESIVVEDSKPAKFLEKDGYSEYVVNVVNEIFNKDSTDSDVIQSSTEDKSVSLISEDKCINVSTDEDSNDIEEGEQKIEIHTVHNESPLSDEDVLSKDEQSDPFSDNLYTPDIQLENMEACEIITMETVPATESNECICDSEEKISNENVDVDTCPCGQVIPIIEVNDIIVEIDGNDFDHFPPDETDTIEPSEVEEESVSCVKEESKNENGEDKHGHMDIDSIDAWLEMSTQEYLAKFCDFDKEKLIPCTKDESSEQSCLETVTSVDVCCDVSCTIENTGVEKILIEENIEGIQHDALEEKLNEEIMSSYEIIENSTTGEYMEEERFLSENSGPFKDEGGDDAILERCAEAKEEIFDADIINLESTSENIFDNSMDNAGDLLKNEIDETLYEQKLSEENFFKDPKFENVDGNFADNMDNSGIEEISETITATEIFETSVQNGDYDVTEVIITEIKTETEIMTTNEHNTSVFKLCSHEESMSHELNDTQRGKEELKKTLKGNIEEIVNIEELILNNLEEELHEAKFINNDIEIEYSQLKSGDIDSTSKLSDEPEVNYGKIEEIVYEEMINNFQEDTGDENVRAALFKYNSQFINLRKAMNKLSLDDETKFEINTIDLPSSLKTTTVNEEAQTRSMENDSSLVEENSRVTENPDVKGNIFDSLLRKRFSDKTKTEIAESEENIKMKKPIRPLRTKKCSMPILPTSAYEAELMDESNFNLYLSSPKVVRPPRRRKRTERKAPLKCSANYSYSMTDISTIDANDVDFASFKMILHKPNDSNIVDTSSLMDLSLEEDEKKPEVCKVHERAKFASPEISSVIIENEYMRPHRQRERISICLIEGIDLERLETREVRKTPCLKRKANTFSTGDKNMSEIKNKLEFKKKSSSVKNLIKRTFSINDVSRSSDNPPCLPNLFRRFKNKKGKKEKPLPTIPEECHLSVMPRSDTCRSFASIFMSETSDEMDRGFCIDDTASIRMSDSFISFPEPEPSLRGTTSSLEASQRSLQALNLDAPPTTPRTRSNSRVGNGKQLFEENSTVSLNPEALNRAQEMLNKSISAKSEQSPKPPARTKSRTSLNSLSRLDLEEKLRNAVESPVERKPRTRRSLPQALNLVYLERMTEGSSSPDTRYFEDLARKVEKNEQRRNSGLGNLQFSLPIKAYDQTGTMKRRYSIGSDLTISTGSDLSSSLRILDENEDDVYLSDDSDVDHIKTSNIIEERNMARILETARVRSPLFSKDNSTETLNDAGTADVTDSTNDEEPEYAKRRRSSLVEICDDLTTLELRTKLTESPLVSIEEDNWLTSMEDHSLHDNSEEKENAKVFTFKYSNASNSPSLNLNHRDNAPIYDEGKEDISNLTDNFAPPQNFRQGKSDLDPNISDVNVRNEPMEIIENFYSEPEIKGELNIESILDPTQKNAIFSSELRTEQTEVKVGTSLNPANREKMANLYSQNENQNFNNLQNLLPSEISNEPDSKAVISNENSQGSEAENMSKCQQNAFLFPTFQPLPLSNLATQIYNAHNFIQVGHLGYSREQIILHNMQTFQIIAKYIPYLFPLTALPPSIFANESDSSNVIQAEKLIENLEKYNLKNDDPQDLEKDQTGDNKNSSPSSESVPKPREKRPSHCGRPSLQHLYIGQANMSSKRKTSDCDTSRKRRFSDPSTETGRCSDSCKDLRCSPAAKSTNNVVRSTVTVDSYGNKLDGISPPILSNRPRLLRRSYTYTVLDDVCVTNKTRVIKVESPVCQRKFFISSVSDDTPPTSPVPYGKKISCAVIPKSDSQDNLFIDASANENIFDEPLDEDDPFEPEPVTETTGIEPAFFQRSNVPETGDSAGDINVIRKNCSLNCKCALHEETSDERPVKILSMKRKENPEVIFRTWLERQNVRLEHEDPFASPVPYEAPTRVNSTKDDTPSPVPASPAPELPKIAVENSSSPKGSPKSAKKDEDRAAQKDRSIDIYPETLRQRQRSMAPSPNKVDIKNWAPAPAPAPQDDEESKSGKGRLLPSVKALRSQFETGRSVSQSSQSSGVSTCSNFSLLSLSPTALNGHSLSSHPPSPNSPPLSTSSMPPAAISPSGRSSSSSSSSTSSSSLAMSSLETSSGFGSLTSSQITLENDDHVEPIYTLFKNIEQDFMNRPPNTTGWNPHTLLKRLYHVPSAPKVVGKERNYINIEGYLEKLPSGRKKATFWNAWKRRYFVAKDGVLYYYQQNNQSEKASMKLPLSGGRVEMMDPNMVSIDDGDREIRSAGMLSIDDGKGHYVVVRCPTRQEAEKWRKALESHIGDDLSTHFLQPWPRPTNPTLLRDTLVIDIGSSSIRAGVLASQVTLPQLFFPSVVSTNRETRKQTYGSDALLPDVRQISSVNFPIRQTHRISKYSIDLAAVTNFLQKIFTDLNVDPKNYYLQLSVPRILNPHTQTELLRILFEKFAIKGVNLTHQAILALYAYDATSGIIVDIGERMDVVPVIDGYIVDGGVSRVPYGGYRIQEHLRQFLFQRNISLINEAESYVIRQVMENICYCAHHYNTEKARCSNSPDNFEKSTPLNDIFPNTPQYECYQDIALDFGRFQATEGLFNPDAWGLDHPGIHKLVYKAIQECSMDIRKEMSRSIFLSGGVTQLPGFADRLSTEMDNLTPMAIRPKVHASPYRYHASFLGACALAESPAFAQSRITREDWIKQGTAALKKWAM